MEPGIGALLLLGLSFIVTFTLARALSRRLKRRGEEREREQRRMSESRQVRRARERKGS